YRGHPASATYRCLWRGRTIMITTTGLELVRRVGLRLAGALVGGLYLIPAAAGEGVVIRGIPPLTGLHAPFRTRAEHGGELSAETINAAGGIKSLGGARIKLVVADIPTPNTAAEVTQRLASQNNVTAIVGTFMSSTTLAASEVTERSSIPLVTFAFADQITER